MDPEIAARIMAWSGEQIISRHVAARAPDEDPKLARELALQRWYGVYVRTEG